VIAPKRGLSSQGAALLVNNYLPPNSIAVSCIGWQMGKVAKITRSSFTNQQINTIIPHTDVEPDFIYYSLCTRREELKALGSVGTRTPILIKSTFENIQIPIPPLPTQHKIAAILSAYDDLIENNTRRIAILEEMAQSLYREWFVHFRFPGHEKNGMVKSALGLIPEGWEVKAFSEVAVLIKKSIDPGKFEQDTFEYYSIPAFDAGCMPTMNTGKEIKSNKFLVPEGAILLSKINPRIPRIWLTMRTSSSHAVASTEFLVLVPRPPCSREFLFSSCRSTGFIDEFASRAVGTSTSHQRVKPEDFMNLLILQPENILLYKFTEVVTPMFQCIYNLRLRNANLRKTRDLLLPKLISGEMDVEGLEIAGVDETGEVETKAIEV
jgi:type I restriction enzyme, S subunit